LANSILENGKMNYKLSGIEKFNSGEASQISLRIAIPPSTRTWTRHKKELKCGENYLLHKMS
jgi:hypothetical protein